MFKSAFTLICISFPLGFIGAIAGSYNCKLSGNTPFQDINLFAGTLIGSVTTVALVGFLLGVHWKIVAVPKDLFTGPLGPFIGSTTDASIFRKGLITTLALGGAGLGLICSSPLFKIDTLGIGISEFIPGLMGSLIIILVWKSLKPDD